VGDRPVIPEHRLGSGLQGPEIGEAGGSVAPLKAQTARSSELEPVLGVTGQGRLIGQPGEHVRAELGSPCLPGESEGVVQVPLRQNMLAVVERHPSDEVELLRPGLVELPAGLSG
jgi:hypothetical protein